MGKARWMRMIVLKSDLLKANELTYDAAFEKFIRRYTSSLNKKTLELLKKLRQILTLDDIETLLYSGKLTPETIQNIEDIISRFSQSQIQPISSAAAETIVRNLKAKAQGLDIDTETIRGWNELQKESFDRMMVDTQLKALTGTALYIQSNSKLFNLNPRELARVIKDSGGLHGPDMKSVLNHYGTLRESGISQQKAREVSAKAIERKMKERAKTISNDGVKNIYRSQEYRTVIRAQEQGLFDGVVKKWVTAGDKNVCPICQAVKNKVVPLEHDFIFPDGTPHSGTDGAHPRCRCAIAYYDAELYREGLIS